MALGGPPSLKGRALRLLSAREHSRAELLAKLREHEQAPGELAGVLDELQAKGLPNEAGVVQSVVPRRAGAVWQRKFGTVASDAREQARQMRFLAGRGFSAAVIRRVVRDTGAEDEGL